MRSIKYFLGGVILGIGLTSWWFLFNEKWINSPPAQTALTVSNERQEPFAVIYTFYRALAAGKEEELAAVVTADFNVSEKYNFLLKEWRQRRQQDPTLQFVFFLIKEQEIDWKKGIAHVKGYVELVSSRKEVISIPQTITILNEKGIWKIHDIQKEE
ncbi:hypothetical protein MHOCP_12100 [Moorella humiferrea]|uniref:DUF4878 domain-containing protein n=1 Tax=Neomoorella humiferrea TaxID=676965 RepID=A0A2T0AXJ8_9FIRM|nr:hypothetical protein [Moorella humiferrea]PRR75547.1 hypothetical protein MOHU_03140 [Moorella humiferrea]